MPQKIYTVKNVNSITLGFIVILWPSNNSDEVQNGWVEEKHLVNCNTIFLADHATLETPVHI